MLKENLKNEFKLNDFFQLGRYTFLVTLLLFLMLVNQIGIMLYMTFAGRISNAQMPIYCYITPSEKRKQGSKF